jgi:hypothetical protein
VAAYRYLLCDLLTDQPLADLPLSGVKFDRRISRRGSLQGGFLAPTSKLVEVGRLAKAYAGRSALWVYRDGALWWGGIPWTVNAKQGPRGAVAVSVTAATFDSYAHRRDLYVDKTYTAADQGVIIPDLWRTIQTDPRGDIGMVSTDQPTGVLRDRTYLATEHAKVGKLIEDLGDVIDGPEHTVDVFVDTDGSRVKSLRVGQRLGSTVPRIVFQRAVRGGGRVVEWEDTSDATAGGTTFQTRGDAPTGNVGEDTQPLVSDRAYRLDLLADGWPLLDETADYPGVIDLATLNGYAEAMSDQQGGSMPTQGYTVQVGNTGWNPNRLGDLVRLKLLDLWHDTVLDTAVRPVGCEVTPEGRDGAELVTLLLGED